MQEETRPASHNGRWLPWIISAALVALYLATVSRWLTVQSLTVVAQVGGWDDNIPASAPLLYLVTRPLLLLPASSLPIAGNLFTVLLAAATLWTLVRCVILLPQDRTHPQRIRGYADGRSLDTRLAWVPAVLAAVTFGLQITTWEHATALSGEMLNVLVFGTAIRGLLEYRRSGSQRWADLVPFLVGIGMTNNWAMTGFAPFFIAAFLWIGGWEGLQVGRILRALLIGLAGMSLFLLMPIIGAGKGGLPESTGEALWALITTQKDILLGISKAKFLILASVMILPLGVAGFRWSSPRGSGLERMATFAAITLLQFVWLAGNLWMLFDGPFSPRKMVTMEADAGGLPLLTFQFCAALSVGYIAAYFIVLGTIKPDRQWTRTDLASGPIQPAIAWLTVAASVLVPAALLYRNLPAMRLQNGSILSDLAIHLAAPLPDRPSLIVTDNPVLQALLEAQLRRGTTTRPHLIVNANRAPEAPYRRHLARWHAKDWPELTEFAEARENVGGVFLRIFAKSAQAGLAFTLTPNTSFLTEQHHLVPTGAIFTFRPYEAGQVVPPAMTPAEREGLLRFWNVQKANLDLLGQSPALQQTLGGGYAAAFWSKTANAQGVHLQRDGHLDDASHLFALARKLDPDNLSASVNVLVNDSLRNKRPIPAEASKIVESYAVSVADIYGPIDEPRFLERFGSGVLELGDPFVRASAVAYNRARNLDPASIEAAIGYARACAAANEPKLALEALAIASRLAREGKPTAAQRAQLYRVEASAHLRAADLAQAEKVLLAGLQEFPEDIPMLDLLGFAYLNASAPQKALPFVERLLKLKPEDEQVLQRQGFLLLSLNRFDDAVATFDKILRRNPDDITAHMNRAAAHLGANRAEKAEEDFQAVLDLVPDAMDARVGLAEAAFRKKDKPAAIRHLEKAIANVPPGGIHHSNLTLRLSQIKAAP